MALNVERSQDYSFRIPVPPRIVIPPPPSGDQAVALLDLGPPNIFSPENAQVQFQQYGLLVPQLWTYDRRHQAQHILPYLLLGPMSVTRDTQWLSESGITLAFGVRHGQSRVLDAALARCTSVGIETHNLSVNDEDSLVSVYHQTAQILTRHLQRVLELSNAPGKIMVFCESGNERSAAVAAAFVMSTHNNVDHIKAMQLCQLLRFCCNFYDALKRSLQSYWDILQAERESAKFAHISTMGQQRGTTKHQRLLKRSFDEEDEDTIETGAWDQERFVNRVNAPFLS